MGKMLSEVLISEYNRILSIAFMMVDNDADAQDLAQDLAEKILRNDVPATTYQKPLAYFSKIMRNKRRDDLRAGKGRGCSSGNNRYVYRNREC